MTNFDQSISKISDVHAIRRNRGVPKYRAPELYTADEPTLYRYSFQADVWSVGILLLDLFAYNNARWEKAHFSDGIFASYCKTVGKKTGSEAVKIREQWLERIFPNLTLVPGLSLLIARVLDPNPATRISMMELKTALMESRRIFAYRLESTDRCDGPKQKKQKLSSHEIAVKF